MSSGVKNEGLVLLAIFLQSGSFPLTRGPCDDGAPGAHLPFCNKELSFAERAADLVARIPADEKVPLLSTSSGGVKALGISSFEWWNEGLHGVRCGHGIDCASGQTTTIFPQPIAAAATFNQTLWHVTGDAISTEFRAFNNVGKGFLSIFSPNINIFRDPRWGRGQETLGEDPLVAAQYAASYVGGMQGDPAKAKGYLKTLTTCKHFAGFNSGFNLRSSQDQGFNALITDQDMADTYLVPFKACITEAKGASVMCSYNAINGIPSCGNRWLLTDVLRKEFGFDGYVVSDCGAVRDLANMRFPRNQSCLAAQGTVAPSYVSQTSSDCWTANGSASGFPTQPGAKTVGASLAAGTDLDCGPTFGQSLPGALKSKDVSAFQVDVALRRLFLGRMRTGEFDPPEEQPYRQIPFDVVNSRHHQALALDSARQALTLLKNQGNVLPFLKVAVNSVAVIGPNANCTLKGPGKSCNQLGNYATFAPFVITPVDGIQKYAKVIGCQGSKVSGSDKSEFVQAVAQAKSADATVLVMGMLVSRAAGDQPGAEGEGNDRNVSIAIPQVQLDLVDAVANATAAMGKPLIVVVMSGSYLDLTPWKMDSRIGAMLWTGYPGMMGGQALAEVLFGDTAPSGRLPYTILNDRSLQTMNAMDMDMRPKSGYPGRSYRFYKPSGSATAPVYPFGFGLHYTNFTYEWHPDADEVGTDLVRRSILSSVQEYLRSFASPQSARLAISEGRKLTSQSVSITNIGTVAQSTTVLAFAVPPGAGSGGRPLQQLFGFSKVYLEPGQSKVLRFDMCERDFTLVDNKGVRSVVEGSWKIRIGVGTEVIEKPICVGEVVSFV